MTTNFLPLSFVAVFGSGIRDGLQSGFGIRDKHPGSATLGVFIVIWSMVVEFDRSRFELFTLRTVQKSVDAPTCEMLQSSN